MKSYSCLFAVLVVALPAHADSADADSCTRIEDDRQRLKCYDDAFGRPVADAVEIAEFGAEHIEAPPIDFVEARLVGDFKGWTGKTVFTLDNGQVWRQTKNYIQDYKPRDPVPAPKVTITKGMMGSYNMEVEGVKRIVQVRRVK